MKSSPSLILVGFLVVGCASSPSSKPQSKTDVAVPEVKITTANQRDLFPFAEGNKWTYSVDITRQLAGRNRETTTGEMEYQITKVTKDGGFTKATISVLQDGVRKDEQQWGVDDKGIYQLSIRKDRVAYTPKQPVVRFPIKDQDKFDWDGKGLTPIGKLGRMVYAFKQDGMQNADTAMGSLYCVYMQSGGGFKNNDGTAGKIGVNSWFAPGIGLARYRQVVAVKEGESSITLRLKSYTVKK